MDALIEAKEIREDLDMNNKEILDIIAQNEEDPDILNEFEELGEETKIPQY